MNKKTIEKPVTITFEQEQENGEIQKIIIKATPNKEETMDLQIDFEPNLHKDNTSLIVSLFVHFVKALQE